MPVLVIPADNEAGFEPNRSVLPESISPEERRSFAHDWLAARCRVRVRLGDGHGPIPRADRQAARIRRGPFPPGPAAGAVGAVYRGRRAIPPGPGPGRVSPALPVAVPGYVPPHRGAGTAAS